ncbi:MAG: putative sulfate exporter family transporter [Rhizobiaceae bacterium]
MHPNRSTISHRASAKQAPGRQPAVLAFSRQFAPGFLLCIVVAVAALALQRLPGMSNFSSLGIAMVLGILLGNAIRLSGSLRPGIAFATKRVLRFAVVLMGFQVTWSAIAGLGWGVVTATALILALTFIATKWMGKRLGVDDGLAELIAAGTAVCGATAVVSTNTVTRASEEVAAYAVASVTLFGTVAIFLYPQIAAMIGLDPKIFGTWIGMSVHEVAQVTAASYSGGVEALEPAIIAKFARVLLLGPLVLALCVAAAGRASPEGLAKPKVAVPWFVLAFAVLVAINSLIEIPVWVRGSASVTSAFLLTTALAAIGLDTNIAKFRSLGPSPLILGAFSSAFIAITSLCALIMLR